MKLTKSNWIVFLIVVLIFTAVEYRGLFIVAPGDENVYYYMAKSAAEGQLPYRDFFLAHPPLQIIILGAIIKIIGINFAFFKSAELISLLIASFFLYKTSFELFKDLNNADSQLISFVSLVLFLFSFEVMFKATFALGLNLSIMLVMAGFYLIFTKRYFFGGIIAGLAGLTRFYALVPMLAVFIFIFIRKLLEKKPKDFLIMVLGFLLIFGIAIAIFTIKFGHDFTDDVIKYHFMKPKLPNQRSIVFYHIITEDWVLIAAFLSSIFIKNRKKFQLFYFVVFSYFAFLLMLNVPIEFYFSMAFPFMAIIGAYSFCELIRKIGPKPLKIFVVAVISLIFLWNLIPDIVFLEKYGLMQFQPLSQMTGTALATKQNQYLFGDDGTVSLLALLSNKSIALNYIDSNEMRFTSGLSNFYLFEDELNKANLSYIIYRKDKGLHQILQFRQYAESRCRPYKEFFDTTTGYFLVYKC